MNLTGKIKEIDLDYLLEVECKTQVELNNLVEAIKKAPHNPSVIVNQGKLYLSTYDFKLLSPIFLNFTYYTRVVNN